MSTFNNPPVNEGDALTAATLNAKAGTDLETPVNDLEESSIERYALDAQHLPALSMSDIFSSGYEVAANVGASSDTTGVYSNSLPLSAANTAYPFTYQTFDSSTTGTAIAYYGGTDPASAATAHNFLGWRIPAYNNTSGNAAEIALASATNFTTAEIKGVICKASLEPVYANLAQVTAGPTPYLGQASLAMAIGWEDGAGNRHVVERSVRFFSVEACRQGSAEVKTFLTSTDLAAGDNTCAKIFLAIAAARPGNIVTEGGARGTTANGDDDIFIKYYNLSVLPLKAGSL